MPPDLLNLLTALLQLIRKGIRVSSVEKWKSGKVEKCVGLAELLNSRRSSLYQTSKEGPSYPHTFVAENFRLRRCLKFLTSLLLAVSRAC